MVTPGPSLQERAITRVAIIKAFWGHFWMRGFAASGLPRKGWGEMGPRHPFLFVVAGELRCSRPERLGDCWSMVVIVPEMSLPQR
jgi:hypothetical protein